jgi:multiple sugar transport system substrate-binding protein
MLPAGMIWQKRSNSHTQSAFPHLTIARQSSSFHPISQKQTGLSADGINRCLSADSEKTATADFRTREDKRLMIKFRNLTLTLMLTATATTFSAPLTAATKLVINSMHSDPTARKSFEAVLGAFKKENPDIDVVVNVVDHESYKIQIRTWLPNNPPDVATWFAGNRARYFVEKGLVEPIDDVWQKTASQFGAGTTAAISFNQHAYLMPVTYYHWGFYYRKDLFKKAGINAAPKTWEDFIATTQKLKTAGLTPITIGVKDGWPAAAWFDFMNMRINGFPFHMALLNGTESYTDPRVKNTMNRWKELLQSGAFPSNAAAMTWQEACAMMWQGKAAMYLMGNFISTEIPANLRNEVGFFPFPTIDPKIPTAEVAPTDVYFIPAKAKNKDNAKKFLAFLAQPSSQQIINDIAKLLPANTATKVPNADAFQKAGAELLKNATNLSQFYDRDANPEVAKVGMDGFVEFMSFPDRMDAVLSKIDKTRLRVNR